MKKLIIILISLSSTVNTIAQNNQNQRLNTKPIDVEPYVSDLSGQIILPILFISFLIFMLTLLVRHFLDFRLKNKMIDKGLSDQLSTYLFHKNDQKSDIIKLAILFCGIGAGLIITYFTRPINIHSLAIMAFSIGLSYFAYFFYLRRQDK
jgi:hypothetical protein